MSSLFFIATTVRAITFSSVRGDFKDYLLQFLYLTWGNQGFVRQGEFLPITTKKVAEARPLAFSAGLHFQPSLYIKDHTQSKNHLVYMTEAFATGRQEAEPWWFLGNLATLWPLRLSSIHFSPEPWHIPNLVALEEEAPSLGLAKCQENTDMWTAGFKVFSIFSNGIHRMPKRQMHFSPPSYSSYKC